MTGRKPTPTALRRARGNPGKRAWNHAEPVPEGGMPTCPRHLSGAAKTEWKRLAASLHRMGVLTVVDRAAMAAYCQCYGRWVEAERKLAETPTLIRTPSGHVQQSPWLSVANRQLDLMGRYMTELGLTPAARSRIVAPGAIADPGPVICRMVFERPDGTLLDSEGREIAEPDVPVLRLTPGVERL